MTIKEHPNGKIIIFSRPIDTGNNFTYFIIFLLFGLMVLKLIIKSDQTDRPFLLICLLIIPTVMLQIAYRFLEKALQREKLIVTKHQFTLFTTGFFTGRKRIFETRYIENFRHIYISEPIKQPMTGKLTEAQINEHLAKRRMENRLAFNYKGQTIKFGENIYSWDFDKLEVIIYDVTGNDLRYTDAFESNFTSP